jgi:transposase
MIRIEFSTAEIEKLHYERYHHPHPKVQQRMEVLYLKSQGLPHQEICRLCHISKVTLSHYLKQYQEGGAERLKQLNYQGQPSALNAHQDTIEAYFRQHPPHTISQAQAEIQRLTGIQRQPTQVRAFLKRIGMRCRKVKAVPGKAVEPDQLAEVEAFEQDQLQPRLAEAKAGVRQVFFVDAAHFVHQSFLGFLWSFTQLWIPSPSGRKRFNVLGALNAVTHEVITVTNETYINSESVCALLWKLANLGLEGTLTIVLDNARYQRCELVKNYAEVLGIELLFLPSYSPQLNLIERLWRFVRKECLYAQHYSDFQSFKQAIDHCIQTAPTLHREKLATLMTWKFQSFKKVNLLTA